jgi:hypothetical protein
VQYPFYYPYEVAGVALAELSGTARIAKRDDGHFAVASIRLDGMRRGVVDLNIMRTTCEWYLYRDIAIWLLSERYEDICAEWREAHETRSAA